MMKIETINNDKFTILTVEGAPIHVRALPMSDAVAWAALATVATQAVAAASDYGAMRDAMVQCSDVLAQYPGINAELLEKLTTEQITGALEALLEVNDPFARRRRRAEADAEKNMAVLAKMPAETVAVILRQHTETISAPSLSNTTLTPS